jgi:hypothetical protein
VRGVRTPCLAVRATLIAAAAALVLGACGGSGGNPSGPSAAATGSAGPAPGEDVAGWCDQAVALSADLRSTVTAAGDAPQQVAPILQRAADRYAGVRPPADIAQDWGLVVGAVRTLAAAAQRIDFTDPDAGTQLAASIGDQEAALDTAATHVESYAQQHCAGGTAAPSS